jgi:dihydroorotase
LQVGADADVTIINPDERWTLQLDQLCSKSRNTPLVGAELQGRAEYVIVSGRIKRAPAGA